MLMEIKSYLVVNKLSCRNACLICNKSIHAPVKKIENVLNYISNNP
jgi:hypothetical protein